MPKPVPPTVHVEVEITDIGFMRGQYHGVTSEGKTVRVLNLSEANSAVPRLPKGHKAVGILQGDRIALTVDLTPPPAEPKPKAKSNGKK